MVKESKLEKINEIIQEGHKISLVRQGPYIPQESQAREIYDLETWFGMPYGTLDKFVAIRN